MSLSGFRLNVTFKDSVLRVPVLPVVTGPDIRLPDLMIRKNLM